MKNNFGKKIVDLLSGIFLPVIDLITAGSIIKSVLMLLNASGIMESDNGIYRIFYAVSDGIFYFLPFLLAITSSKQFGTNKFITLMIPIAFLYPQVTEVLEKGDGFSFIGLKVQSVVYHSSVIPVLLASGLLHFVEIPCDKFLPKAIKGFMKPIISMAIVLPVSFLFFGPAGAFIGSILTKAFFLIYKLNPIVAGAFMGTMIQPMVSIGAHWAIVPVAMNNIAEFGFDTIMPLLAGAVYGQAGAAFAVGLRETDADKKLVSFQSSFTACIGVTEPALYGVNLPRVRPMVFGCIAGGVGGAITGFAGTHCLSFAFPSILTSVAFVGKGFGLFLLSMPICFAIGFILTWIFGKIEKQEMTLS